MAGFSTPKNASAFFWEATGPFGDDGALARPNSRRYQVHRVKLLGRRSAARHFDRHVAESKVPKPR